jgi:hypothetical protein
MARIHWEGLPAGGTYTDSANRFRDFANNRPRRVRRATARDNQDQQQSQQPPQPVERIPDKKSDNKVELAVIGTLVVRAVLFIFGH